MAAMGYMVLPSRADMDEDNYGLILSLMLEDARMMKSESNGKGKQQEGIISDVQFAFELYAQELQDAVTIDTDHRLSESMQRASLTDANTIVQLQQEEFMAQHDHDVAVALSEGRDPPPMPLPMPLPATEPVPEIPKAHNAEARQPHQAKDAENFPVHSAKRPRTEGFDFRDEGDDDVILHVKRARHGESSTWAANRQPPANQRPCTSCMEPTPEPRLIRTPCNHEYCHDCIRSLFTSAMRDETLFPPKCCRQAMPVVQYSQILGSNLVDLYHTKQIEFSTENRIYCHNTECGAFIKPGDVGHCSGCDLRTCVSCKKAAHEGDCPQDTELHSVLELAEQEGWSRCTKCSAMIELALGCNHITCRCSYQFCYVCGAEWNDPKECLCPVWNEENLIDRVAEIDQRHDVQPVADPQGQPQVHPQVQQARVQDQVHRVEEQRRIAAQVRMNHDCDHDGEWRRVRVQELKCERCAHDLPYYLYECSQCQILVCRKCRFNRM